ncbi:hypothetical protein PRIPAC_79412 [Pristionchus pacificus]|uniref:G protein-coupled receptor n=1 Tax=Pristionchus pacificus TaxID=54126 RepID=A0A2A6C1T6_PRIPA|nr:hypothetical protein PRIPAC_79412 [Pristionchus pacificus]|eukprot:PDM72124.1 G protein-coupled receptor [Pristionchus pacificus]
MKIAFSGNTNSLAPPMLISQGIVICGPLPLFIAIWIYRSMILRGLYEKTKSMSIHTRALHKQFVSALTLQAVLPIFPLLGVGVSLLGILGVASDPALEIAPIILCELPAFISPLIVILHIRYYSDAVRLLFQRERKRRVIGVSARSPTTARSFAPF